MHRSTARLMALLVATASCRSAAPVAGPPRARGEATVARPAWLEPLLEWPPVFVDQNWNGIFDPPARLPTVLATGAHAALVRGGSLGFFVEDETRGFTGPYAFGDVASAAIGATGSLYLARTDGLLYRSDRKADGTWTSATLIGPFPTPKHWIAAGPLLAGYEGREVFVSSDQGASWMKRPLDAEVVGLWGRPDGVLVLQLAAAPGTRTRVSSDGGRTWGTSVRIDHIRQLGGWIYGNGCDGAGQLRSTALAADGRTWVYVTDPWPSGSQRTFWLYERFRFSPEMAASPPRQGPWADDVSAPSASLPPFTGAKDCPKRAPRVVRVNEQPETTSAAEPACSGVACLKSWRATPPYPTRTSAYLLHDGLCVASPDDGECPPGYLLSRPPHLAIVNDATVPRGESRTLRLVDVPAGCKPRFVTFGAGLIVVPCVGAVGNSHTSTVYTAAADGRWYNEGNLPIDETAQASDFEMRADGTAMFAVYGGNERGARAWVRAPLDAGAQNAWRDVSMPRAAGYTLRDRGTVEVVIAEPERGPDAFSLIESRRDGQTRVILAHAAAGGDLWCIGSRGKEVLGLRKASGRFETVAITGNGATVTGTPSDSLARSYISSHYTVCGE